MSRVGKHVLFGWMVLTPCLAVAGGSIAARTYEKECGGCHAAFAPALLPVESWEQLLGNLRHHFGRHVAPPAGAMDRISIYLAAHAGKGRAPLGAEPRFSSDRNPRDAGCALPPARPGRPSTAAGPSPCPVRR